MTDNLLIKTGADAAVATDEIGGVHHQRIKIQHGADGTATDVSSASPLPVTRVGTIKYASVNATNDGDNTVIAGVGGVKIRVLGYALTCTGTGTVLLQDTAGSPVIHARIRSGGDGGGASYGGGHDAPAFETATGTGVEVSNPAGVDTLGHITYIEV